MGVLRFDGADWIRFQNVNVPLADASLSAFTVAVLFKQAVDSGFQAYGYLCASGPTSEAGIGRNSSGNLINDSHGYVGAGQDVTGTTTTHIAVARKPSGLSAVTYSMYSKTAGTWAAEVVAGTLADRLGPSEMLEIGTLQGGGDLANAWIGLYGFWVGDMTQTNVELLDNNWKTSDWWNSPHSQPVTLIEFDKDPDLVYDLTGNATNVMVTGTPTIDAGETLDSWNFDGTGTPPPDPTEILTTTERPPTTQLSYQ